MYKKLTFNLKEHILKVQMSINHRLMDGKAFSIKNLGVKLRLPQDQLKYYSHKVDSNKKNSASINHDKGVIKTLFNA